MIIYKKNCFHAVSIIQEANEKEIKAVLTGKQDVI